MTFCSTCQGAQSECQERLDASGAYRDTVNRHLEPESMSYEPGGGWWNKNFLWILVEEIGLDALREKVERPLEGLRLAPFYGCYIVRRLKRLGFADNPTRPVPGRGDRGPRRRDRGIWGARNLRLSPRPP